MSSFLTLFIGLPFLAFLILFGRGKSAGYLSLSVATLSFLGAIYLYFHIGIELNWVWFGINNKPFSCGFFVDLYARQMLLLVSFVSLLVQIFSIAYLHHEPNQPRYFALIQLFTGAMFGIILADNLLLLYVFWELVGLASYLLIGFWYERPAAAEAAKKAFLMNRIGDVALLIGIFGLWQNIGTIQFLELLHNPPNTSLTVWGLLIFGGSIAKSAQFPLHTWLPDAMEGPTPVSALIHAATMVAAGVFLMIRVYPILTPDSLFVIASIGGFTALLGGFYAVFQSDIKKNLAYSTVSQLGLMFFALGVAHPEVALFQLITHGFFKAGLFLSAGAVIHSLEEKHHPSPQDTRQMGGLRKNQQLIFWCYTICAAALASVPFTSGFLAKENLLHWLNSNLLLQAFVFFSAGITAFYTTKQWRAIFLDEPRYASTEKSYSISWLMSVPLVILAALSFWFFYEFNPFGEYPHLFLVVLSVFVTGIGGYLGWRNVNLYRNIPTIDNLYRSLFVVSTQKIAQFFSWIDTRILDGFVNGFSRLQVVIAGVSAWLDTYFVDGIVRSFVGLIMLASRWIKTLQNGQIQAYLSLTMLGVLALLWWWLA